MNSRNTSPSSNSASCALTQSPWLCWGCSRRQGALMAPLLQHRLSPMQGVWELIPELPARSLLTSSSESEKEKSFLSLVSWLPLVASSGTLAATETSSGSSSAPETHSGKTTPPGHENGTGNRGWDFCLHQSPVPRSHVEHITHFNNTAASPTISLGILFPSRNWEAPHPPWNSNSLDLKCSLCCPAGLRARGT